MTVAFDTSPDVRFAVPDDEDAMMDLSLMIHEEIGQHEIDKDKVRAVLNAMCNRRSSMAGVIGKEGGPLMGMVLLAIESVWYSSEYQLAEMANFVHPDYRKQKYAKQLINFAKRCSDNLGIDLMIGIVSNKRTEAKVKLYQRQVEYAGAFFTHRPNGA